ncbi:MAG TPA: hypothetical protein VGJ51_17210 [Candidatus Angelobacter sp.]
MAPVYWLRGLLGPSSWAEILLAFLRQTPPEAPDSSDWQTTEADVYSAKAGYLYGTMGTEIWYSYHAEGDAWSGTCWIPFADEPSARYYAGSRPPGSKVRIRYCPGDAHKSAMLEKDQPDANPLAVQMQMTD